MSQDIENFEQLRRLLRLKRFEQPPPRYFHEFSAQVIARIERGERGEGHAGAGWMSWEAGWVHRIWAAFEAKPVLAGAFGVAVCATLITGVIRSAYTDLQPAPLGPVMESAMSGPVGTANAMADNHPMLVRAPLGFIPSAESSSSSPVSLANTGADEQAMPFPTALMVEGSNSNLARLLQTGGPLFGNGQAARAAWVFPSQN
jgi:hypothetical protein